MRFFSFLKRLFSRKKAGQIQTDHSDSDVSSEAFYTPEPVKPSEPVYQPEPVKPSEPVYQPEPVKPSEPVYRPEPVKPSGIVTESVVKESELVMERAPAPLEQSRTAAPDSEERKPVEKAAEKAVRPATDTTPASDTLFVPAAAPASVQPGKTETRIIRRTVILPSNRLVNVRYEKSFTAKLIQTSDGNKAYYNELKNELLSYKKVHSRISWRQDSFRKGRETVARLAVRGKTLCLYLALDAAKYEGSKYIVEDVSEVKKNEDTPCLYRIKNDRRLRYAKELIAELMSRLEAVKQEIEYIDYAKDYPYEENEPLLERGLIRLIEERRKIIEEEIALSNGELNLEVPREVTVAAAEELLKDEIAEILVRESENASVKGKQTIVNVDTLDEYFEDGETVTLEKMRERIPFLNKKAETVKVLARGSISKSLEVEADDFSLAAVKMIILAGGNVYRKRSY